MKMHLSLAVWLTVMPATALAQTPVVKAPKQAAPSAALNRPFAIAGLASSGRQCIGPSGANIHSIGWVPGNSRVTVTFSSDFDPVASITIMQMGLEAPDGRARSNYVFDDDSGGNLEPELRFTTSFSGTLVLHVSKFSESRDAGCYFYKVEIVTG
jgi:hypothetical protein